MLVAFKLRARLHRDVLRAYPVGRVLRQARLAPSWRCASAWAGLPLMICCSALASWARGMSPLRAVDHAELVPRERGFRGRARQPRAAPSRLRRGGTCPRWRCSAWPKVLAISGSLFGQLGRPAQGRQRIGGLARFEQDLALDLEEIGIVRLVASRASASRTASSSLASL